MPLLLCFRWSFFVEKTPKLKINMDVDFEPDSPTCFFSLPAPATPERVRGCYIWGIAENAKRLERKGGA